MTSAVNLQLRPEQTGPRASFFVFLAGLLVATILSGCGDPGPGAFSYSGSIMGTTYQVKVVAPSTQVTEDLGDQILAVLVDIDRKMSTYKPDSELNRLNAAPIGQKVTVSPELLAVLVLSRDVYRATEGAFDPTVGPLVDLWGFGPAGTLDDVPEAATIARALREVGMGALSVDEVSGQVTKTRPLSLDLSAVAKGYAADRVGELLRHQGLSSYMVEVGGEMAVAGRNERGTPWQIAIEKPQGLARTVQQVVGVSDAGVATSGDYRNYFEKEGVRYSHTIDPRTGYPITHSLVSVTVITPSSGYADALATAFMVMGTERTLAFAEREKVPVYTLSKSENGFDVAHSSAFDPYLEEVQ